MRSPRRLVRVRDSLVLEFNKRRDTLHSGFKVSSTTSPRFSGCVRTWSSRLKNPQLKRLPQHVHMYRGYTTQESRGILSSRRIRRNPGTPSSPLKQDLHCTFSVSVKRSCIIFWHCWWNSLVSGPSVQQPRKPRPYPPIWSNWQLITHYVFAGP